MANESITKSEALRRIAESTEQIRLYTATIKTAVRRNDQNGK
jgi:hypothetical protein